MFEQCVIYPLESDLGPSEFNVNSHRKHMTHGTYTIAGNWTWMTWYLFVLSVPMATPWNWTIYIYIYTPICTLAPFQLHHPWAGTSRKSGQSQTILMSLTVFDCMAARLFHDKKGQRPEVL